MFTTFAMEEVRESSWATEPLYEDKPKHSKRHQTCEWKDRFFKRYGLLLVGACLFTLYTLILSWTVHALTVRDVKKEMAIEYSAQLEAYKKQEAERIQAEYFMSGDASREAAINQEVDAVAAVISKLSTDAQKLTEASCMLARVMNPSYPNSFKEVASQDSQWMFYDGSDKTFSEHDRELAESIVRPYMEHGIVPNGLTQNHVYGAWTPNSFELREQYETKSAYKTWSYPG